MPKSEAPAVTMTFAEYYEIKSKAQAYDNILNQIRPVDYAQRPERNWPVCQDRRTQ